MPHPMSTYDKVEELLREYPELRDSDKKLWWKVCGLYPSEKINLYDLLELPSFETVRRSRQKVQENNPELQASEPVKEFRKDIEKTQGEFVYMQEKML